MNLLTLLPRPLNPKIVPLLGYPKVIPHTKFEHVWIVHFRVMLRTNRQTNRHTGELKNPTDADKQSRQRRLKQMFYGL